MKRLILAAALVPGVLLAQIQSGPAMRKAGNHTFTFTGGEGSSVQTIYSTNFGTTTTIPAEWQRTGGWAGSTSNASSGYSGASGGTNVNGSNDGSSSSTLTVSGISTTGFTDITVLWGARRSASFTNAVTLQWSTDGSNWNAVSYTQVPNNTTWALVNGGTEIALPSGAAGASNLRLRLSFTQAGNTGAYRVDDFIVRGLSSGGSGSVSWSVDRLTRPELSKTGSFSRASGVMTASGTQASFNLTYVSGNETKYEIFATPSGGSASSTIVQVFPADTRVSFMHESSGNPRVPVYIVVPDSLNPQTTRAVSIHHGVNRDGDAYCDYWKPWAIANNTIAFAPTFDDTDWPGSSAYHQGNVLNGSSLRAESQWSFTVARRIMEKILGEFGLAATQVDAWGHSAGGQFVHRMAFFQGGAPVRLWMANNPGYWTLADLNVAWPHGLQHAAFSFTAADVTAWTNRSVIVYRGMSDVHRDSNVDTAANSELQGRFRFARADTAMSRVRAHNSGTAWRINDVPHVGHDGELMSERGGEFLIANSGSGTLRTLGVSVSGKGAVYFPWEQSFAHGGVVTLEPTPEEGYVFAQWSGDLSGTSNPGVLPMDGSKAVTANFSTTSRRVIYWTGFDRLSTFPSNWTASSGWTLSTSNSSSGYGGPSPLTGASSFRNAVVNRQGSSTQNLTLANLNTVGYSNLRVTWGARRSPSFVGQVTLQWSANGSTWNTISPWTDSANDNIWRRVPDIALPVGATGLSNLRLRWSWTQSGTTSATYRIDDIVLTGENATARTTVLNESFGTGSSLPANWTTSGTGWAVENQSGSSGYEGSSGGSNLRASNSGGTTAATVTRASVATTGYRHVSVSWGASRSAAFHNPVQFQWSIDGTNWYDVPYQEIANVGTWDRVNRRVEVELPISAWNVSNLQLRWSFTRANNAGTYRIDDVRVYGVAAAGSAGE